MSGGHMQSQCLRMEELFLACRTLEREMTLMLLHMIVHSILVFFGGLANAADKLAVGILLVFHCHGY